MARLDVENVKGVGPSAARKLRGFGIKHVEQLAELDLRSASLNGLSRENVARLRENARSLIAAASTGELTLVEGLGPLAARKLEAAGVKTIEDLVALDLRRRQVPGLSTENLERLKRNASYLVPE